MSKNKEKLSFEEKIKRIQQIVAELEETDKSVEEMFELFKEGIKLNNECREYLAIMEKQIIDITNNFTETLKY